MYLDHCEGDLFVEARALRRLGYTTAAVMTARAALDRLIRSALPRKSRGIAWRASTGRCLFRLFELEMLEREQFDSVHRTVSRLSRYCHGISCDDAKAVELITLADDARVALLTLEGVTL